MSVLHGGGGARVTYTEDTDVHRRIRKLRDDRGYTREQLAELAGISAKFLYEIEVKHKGFSARTLKNLADALEVSTDFILTGAEREYSVVASIERIEPRTLEKVDQLIRIAHELCRQTL